MDANTPDEFAQCIAIAGGVSNVLVFTGGIKGRLTAPTEKIPDISLCHHFDFMKDGIMVRKISGIGSGRKVTGLKPVKVKPTYVYKLLSADKIQNFTPLKKSTVPYVPNNTQMQEKEPYYEDEHLEDTHHTEIGSVFSCPNQWCVAEFIRESRCKQHVHNGICKIRKPVESGENFVRTAYISKYGISAREAATQNDLRNTVFHLDSLPNPTISPNLKRLDVPLARADLPWFLQVSMGFALQVHASRKNFSRKQIEYIKNIFDKGNLDQKKARACDVAIQMRVEKLNGELLFNRYEWLNQDQILRLFSKMSAENKKAKKESKKSSGAAKVAWVKVTEEEIEEESNLLDSVTEAEEIDDLNDELVLPVSNILGEHPQRVSSGMKLVNEK